MAIKNPWGDQTDSFENLTQKIAKPVVKAIGDTVKAVVTDAKQQVTGDYPISPENLTGGQPPSAKASVGAGHVQEAAQQKQQLLLQTRQNLEQINKQIQEIRKKRIQQAQQATQAQQAKKVEKKQEEKKKQEDPFWKRMLKGKTGSKEGNVRAGG